MDNIKDLIKENELELSTLVVFTRAEHTIHKKEFQTIKESGLTIAQFGVLEVLYNKGDLRICEIIEKILTTSGNITVVIKNLEKDEGRKVIENILPSHINNIKNIFEVLTDEEKITLKNILKKFKNV